MYKPYEIAHPFRNIHLMAEDIKAFNTKEDQLIERYLKMHSQQMELEDLRLQLLGMFEKHRSITGEVKKEFDKILNEVDQLESVTLHTLTRQVDYKTYKIQHDTIVVRAEKYNDDHNHFIERLEKVTSEMESLSVILEKYRQKVIEIDETFDENSELEDDLYEEFDEEVSALDIASFDTDKEIFLKKFKDSRNEFDQLYADVCRFINDDYNPLVESYNESTQSIKNLNDNFAKLYQAYLLYTKAEEIENDLIYLEWKDENIDLPPEQEIGYGFAYDLEYDENEKIILHLDAHINIEDELYLWKRWSYRMDCSMKEIFTREILETLVGYCVDGMKTEITDSLTESGRKFDLEKIDTSYKTIENISGIIISGQVSINYERLAYVNSLYSPWLRLNKPGGLSYLGITVITVMDQLLFDYTRFDTKKNQDKLNEIIPVVHYATLRKNIINGIQSSITFNLRQWANFLMMLDCVSQLLLGDHENDFILILEKANITAKIRMDFLKTAQKYIRDAMDDFKEKEITIKFLEKKHNWNSIFF